MVGCGGWCVSACVWLQCECLCVVVCLCGCLCRCEALSLMVGVGWRWLALVGVGWRFYRSHQQCTDVSPLRWAADPPTAGRQGPGGQAPQSLQQTWTARPRCGPNHLGLCLFFLNHRWAGRINLAAMPTPTGKALTPPCGILCSTLIPAAPPRRSPFSPFSPFSLHPSLLSSLFSPRQSKSASQPGFAVIWPELV